MSLTLIYQKPNFGLLWVAQLISFIGDGVFQLALVWWVMEKTGSGTLVGLILSLSSLPPVILGPFAGTIADRVHPKLILVYSDIFRSALMLFFAVCAFYDLLRIRYLFILCALLSSAAVFHSPTTLTVIPRVVKPEEIDDAMALHSIVRDLAKLVGPALGGSIMVWFTVAQAFAINGFALLLSALLIFFIVLEFPSTKEVKESLWVQLKQGFVYVKNHRLLFEMLLSFSVLNFFVIPIIVLLPLTVNKLLVLEAIHLGIAEGSLALGSVLTGIFYTKLFTGIATSKLLIYGIGLSGLIFGIIAINRSFYLLVCLLFLLGGCFSSVNIGLMTMYQKVVQPEMKGRFFALVETISFALFPISMAVAGYLADVVTIPVAFLICASGIILLTIKLSRIHDFVKLDLVGND